MQGNINILKYFNIFFKIRDNSLPMRKKFRKRLQLSLNIVQPQYIRSFWESRKGGQTEKRKKK